MSEVEADDIEKYCFTFQDPLDTSDGGQLSELGKEGTGTHKTTDELGNP